MKWFLLILVGLGMMTVSPYRPKSEVKIFDPCFRFSTEIESKFIRDNAGVGTGVSFVIPCDWDGTAWLAALRSEEALPK